MHAFSKVVKYTYSYTNDLFEFQNYVLDGFHPILFIPTKYLMKFMTQIVFLLLPFEDTFNVWKLKFQDIALITL